MIKLLNTFILMGLIIMLSPLTHITVKGAQNASSQEAVVFGFLMFIVALVWRIIIYKKDGE